MYKLDESTSSGDGTGLKFSRTAVALSVCQVLPASSRTDIDHTPHRLVPEHNMEQLHELLLI